jgi:hypothetical protein
LRDFDSRIFSAVAKDVSWASHEKKMREAVNSFMAAVVNWIELATAEEMLHS